MRGRSNRLSLAQAVTRTYPPPPPAASLTLSFPRCTRDCASVIRQWQEAGQTRRQINGPWVTMSWKHTLMNQPLVRQ